MDPLPVVPDAVPAATVRRIRCVVEPPAPARTVAVRVVPSPAVVPRQIDPVALRLMALETEVEFLRAELEHRSTD